MDPLDGAPLIVYQAVRVGAVRNQRCLERHLLPLSAGHSRHTCGTVTLAFNPVSLFFYDELGGGRDGERTEESMGLLH